MSPDPRQSIAAVIGPIAVRVTGNEGPVRELLAHLAAERVPVEPDGPELVIELLGDPTNGRSPAAAGADDRGAVTVGSSGSPVRLHPPVDADPWIVQASHPHDAVPYATSILCLLAVRHGILPLHASAAAWHGRTWVFAGWSGSGKTDALLSTIEQGATPMAADWTYLAGATPVGGGDAIRVRAADLRRHPCARQGLGASQRSRVSALAVAGRLVDAIPVAPVGRISRALESRAHADISLDLLGSPPTAPPPVGHIVLLVRRDGPVSVTDEPRADATEKLMALADADLAPLARAASVAAHDDPERADWFEGFATAHRMAITRTLTCVPVSSLSWAPDTRPSDFIEALDSLESLRGGRR